MLGFLANKLRTMVNLLAVFLNRYAQNQFGWMTLIKKQQNINQKRIYDTANDNHIILEFLSQRISLQHQKTVGSYPIKSYPQPQLN